MLKYKIGNKYVDRTQFSEYVRKNPNIELIAKPIRANTNFVPPDCSDAMTEEQFKKAKQILDNQILDKKQ